MINGNIMSYYSNSSRMLPVVSKQAINNLELKRTLSAVDYPGP
jgi:hypothetical protein